MQGQRVCASPFPLRRTAQPRLTRTASPQEIKHSGGPEGKEAYHITATLDKTTQISVTFERPAEAPGFKYGEGVSVFGADRSEAKRDGIAVQ